jgi:hypothetical protein
VRTNLRSSSRVTFRTRLKSIEGAFNKGEWDSIGGVAEDIQQGEFEYQTNTKVHASSDKEGQYHIQIGDEGNDHGESIMSAAAHDSLD